MKNLFIVIEGKSGTKTRIRSDHISCYRVHTVFVGITEKAKVTTVTLLSGAELEFDEEVANDLDKIFLELSSEVECLGV